MWLMHMCDMTHPSFVWSFHMRRMMRSHRVDVVVGASTHDTHTHIHTYTHTHIHTYEYVTRPWICMARHIHLCDKSDAMHHSMHAYHVDAAVSTSPHDTHMNTWHDSCICVAGRIHMCNMTYSYAPHDACILCRRGSRYIPTWHTYEYVTRLSCHVFTHMRGRTHSYARQDLFMCATWCIHTMWTRQSAHHYIVVCTNMSFGAYECFTRITNESCRTYGYVTWLIHHSYKLFICAVCCSVLQCVAVCCSAMQCITVRCKLFTCAAWHVLDAADGTLLYVTHINMWHDFVHHLKNKRLFCKRALQKRPYIHLWHDMFIALKTNVSFAKEPYQKRPHINLWHDFVHIHDTTHSYSRHCSFVWMGVTHSYIAICHSFYRAFLQTRALLQKRRIFWCHQFIHRYMSHAWMGDTTRACTWQHALIWLIRMCDMTRLHVWHDLFASVTWLICMCDMTHLPVWHDSFASVT